MSHRFVYHPPSAKNLQAQCTALLRIRGRLHPSNPSIGLSNQSSLQCHFRTHAPQQDERSCTAIRSPRRRSQKRRRHVEAERLRHDQVNDEAELGRLLDRKIGGLRPKQNLVD